MKLEAFPPLPGDIAPAERPLVVQSDGTLLLEVASDCAAAARDALSAFAHLERSPEYVHTYRITPLSLWNAAAAGVTVEWIEGVLGRFSRYPVPDIVRQETREQMGRFGRVRLLPGASGVGRLASLNRGELRRLVHRLEPHLDDSELVLIDLSAGLSPATQLFLRAAREIVVVANPEPSAMLDAYGVIKLLVESGHTGQIHLVMNRARNMPGAQQWARRMVTTVRRFLDRGVNLLGCVPDDDAVIDSVHRRRPLVLDRPDSPAASALRMISQQLVDGTFPAGNTLSAFFSTAKALVAPRRRPSRSTCAL